MRIPIFHIDAFTTRRFAGNPAAVMPLRTFLDDVVLQRIAGENNLSETAFLVPTGNDYSLRWFTPITEVPLCGHGDLSANLQSIKPSGGMELYTLCRRSRFAGCGVRAFQLLSLKEYSPSSALAATKIIFVCSQRLRRLM